MIASYLATCSLRVLAQLTICRPRPSSHRVTAPALRGRTPVIPTARSVGGVSTTRGAYPDSPNAGRFRAKFRRFP